MLEDILQRTRACAPGSVARIARNQEAEIRRCIRRLGKEQNLQATGFGGEVLLKFLASLQVLGVIRVSNKFLERKDTQMKQLSTFRSPSDDLRYARLNCLELLEQFVVHPRLRLRTFVAEDKS